MVTDSPLTLLRLTRPLDYPKRSEHRQSLGRELPRPLRQFGLIFFGSFKGLAIFAYALPLSGKQLPRKCRLIGLARLAELQRQNKHLMHAGNGHTSADYWRGQKLDVTDPARTFAQITVQGAAIGPRRTGGFLRRMHVPGTSKDKDRLHDLRDWHCLE